MTAVMEANKDRGIAKKYFYVFTILYLVMQVIFFSDDEVVADDIIATFGFVFLFVLFFILSIRGYLWARIVLTILLLLFGAGIFWAGLDTSSWKLLLVGSYCLFTGIALNISPTLRAISVSKKKIGFTEAYEDDLQNEQEESSLIVSGQEATFPMLVVRIKAVFIDNMLLVVFMLFCVSINSTEEGTPDWLIYVFFAVTLTYEPLLTAYYVTLGQKIMKIRVRNNGNPDSQINLIEAYLRLFTKIFLGWWSFLAILFNNNKRAVHDYVSNSVVINKPR